MFLKKLSQEYFAKSPFINLDLQKTRIFLITHTKRLIFHYQTFDSVQLAFLVLEPIFVCRGFQRKALCFCLGLPGTAGTETVEVAAGIPPLDSYFRQTSIREIAKIQAKSVRQPIKILLNNMTEDNNTQDISRPAISPLRLALTYAK